MHTRVLIISMLLGLWAPTVAAQEVARCEYWIDDDYANRTVTGPQGNKVSLGIPLDGHAPGLHFFNFRAIADNGEAGNLMRTLFYLPEAPADGGVAYAESWFDDDYAGRKFFKSDEHPVLSFDVSGLMPGLHFFNLRAVTKGNGQGNLFRTLFYLPEPEHTDIAGYEYWLDNDTANSVKAYCGGSTLCLTVDVGGLAAGGHTFNFRAKNSFGQWGPTFTEAFVMEELTGIDGIIADGKPFDVYNLAGMLVVKNATASDLKRLPSSIYIIGGRKVLVGSD